MKTLKSYNYQSIIDQLSKVEPKNKIHRLTIVNITHGLENEHRMHWIDDELNNQGLPSTETIFNYYNINLH